MGLLPGPHVRAVRGEVHFGGEDLLRVSPQRLREIRGNEISMVFQAPMTALNPLMTIGRQIDELIQVHTDLPAVERRRQSLEMFESVRLPEPERMLGAYPHEISGGQRQRIGIARALALDPEILVADEPVSALDVSVQAQVLDFLATIRDRLGLTMLFITHDLRVAAQVCDRIAVMHRGELVEYGDTADLFAEPSHPYTRELLSAVPGRGWVAPVFSD